MYYECLQIVYVIQRWSITELWYLYMWLKMNWCDSINVWYIHNAWDCYIIHTWVHCIKIVLKYKLSFCAMELIFSENGFIFEKESWPYIWRQIRDVIQSLWYLICVCHLADGSLDSHSRFGFLHGHMRVY